MQGENPFDRARRLGRASKILNPANQTEPIESDGWTITYHAGGLCIDGIYQSIGSSVTSNLLQASFSLWDNLDQTEPTSSTHADVTVLDRLPPTRAVCDDEYSYSLVPCTVFDVKLRVCAPHVEPIGTATYLQMTFIDVGRHPNLYHRAAWRVR
jgi:hypothetical protein